MLHGGVPEPHGGAADNSLGSLVRSLEELTPVADRYGVRLAVEVIPNALSTPSALVELVESDLEADLGICMDVGHARLMGDVVEAIETCSGHLLTTHLHDNRGKNDDHLVPGKGVINWDATLLAFQKVGYDGVWMFELAAAADRKPILELAVKARDRFEALLHIGDEMLGMDEGRVERFSRFRGSEVDVHTYIEKIGGHEGQTVTIKGWLHNRRSSGKIHFLVVRDGTGFLQVVMGKRDVDEATFTRADHLSQESAIIVTGTVKAEPRAIGGYELIASGLDVVNEAHDYPITPKEHGVDYLMDRRHLWIRAERQTAILRVRHEIINAVRDFFNDQGFILADTPIFTPAACEGTTTLFPVDYFENEKAYLTQSGQLYNEANAMALGRVYAFGPTFRAEKSKTRRHLTEFWMVEPEMAYADLNDVITLAEGLDHLRRLRGCSIAGRKS